ncbi:carbohydrate ABC transporter ATP-binding protein (CUT1 family) [Paracandidimonas soli]|uniref:Carbohydrate ABC transporter ATP-binding protein (CUT1 family) n=2 Tax=Paracandidimonas soli TaxID=1917182 RepID=A0A4R3VFX1_9BURK|nr:carbohydrate ABC transporter ATP-binding protein (CUT1 family) [Paracandidimonas soli]
MPVRIHTMPAAPWLRRLPAAAFAQAESMSTIVLENISKFYGASSAIEDLSLAIPAGSFAVLLGPSGCGKSTALRMIAGLERPTSGRILIDGNDVTSMSPAKRRLSMVFQSYALFPHLSVRENILFGLRARREPSQHFGERLARVANLLGLQALLDRKPSQLSGGQQQRVALGRAVISEAPICLMDEPLSNLDAKLRQEMRREIRQLQQSLGITMVYVTHDQTEAMTMADQVILMNKGRVEQNDTPTALYTRPGTAFAAQFIGTPPMNLLGLHQIGTPLPQGAMPPPAARSIGVRPEHIVLHREAGVPATVMQTEYLGAQTLVTCQLRDGTPVVVSTDTVARPASGAAVHLDWPPDHNHFFDASGLAVSTQA